MRWLKIVRYAVAVALVARLVGLGRSFLPPVGVSLVLIAAVTIVAALVAPAREDSGQESSGRRARRRAFAFARRHAFSLAVAGAVALGIGLRLVGLGAGLGHMPHNMDENRLAGSVLSFLEAGEVPHSTVEHYPGVYYWVLAGGYLATVLAESMRGAADSLGEIPHATFIYAGKLVNVLLFGVTIWLTAGLGRRASGRPAGLVAAYLMAVAPLGLMISTELRNDVPQLLLITATLIAMQSLHRTGRLGVAAGSGALAGIATGMKYTSVFLVVPLAGAALTARRRTSSDGQGATLARLAVLGAGFVAAVMVSNPFVWLDFPNFIHQLTFQVEYTGPGHWAAQDDAAWFYATRLALGFGWPLLLGAGAWLAHTLVAGDWEGRWLASFPLVYVWFMSQRPSQFARWVFPLLSVVAVACAIALCASVRTLVKRRADGSERDAQPGWLKPAPLALALVVLVVLAAAPPTWGAAVLVSRRAGTPTHELVEAWLQDNTERSETVLTQRAWLRPAGMARQMRRVDDLRSTLERGGHYLAYHRWIVVPETASGARIPPELKEVETFLVDTGFGGNTGFDYRVYSAWPVEATAATIQIDLGTPAAEPFLGPEWWDERMGAAAGRRLPPGRGTLYVPLPVGPDSRLEIEIALAGSPTLEPAALRLSLNGARLERPRVEPLESGAPLHRWSLSTGSMTNLRPGVNEIAIVLPETSGEAYVGQVRLLVEDSSARQTASEGRSP